MQKHTPPLTIQETPGDHYAEIAKAQREALPLMSLHLVNVIRDLLAAGVLVQVEDKIIPNPQRSQ